MDEPEHEGFVYQIIVDGAQVIVMADWEDAQRYCKKNFNKEGVSVLILPVAVFKFEGDSK